jgi:hypothetical protein
MIDCKNFEMCDKCANNCAYMRDKNVDEVAVNYYEELSSEELKAEV